MGKEVVSESYPRDVFDDGDVSEEDVFMEEYEDYEGPPDINLEEGLIRFEFHKSVQPTETKPAQYKVFFLISTTQRSFSYNKQVSDLFNRCLIFK